MAIWYDRSSARVGEGELGALFGALDQARDAVHGAWESGTLGFVGCPDNNADPYIGWAQALIDTDQFDTQVVIGVGGSSLGARAVLAAATRPLDGLETHFSENMDPIAFSRLFDRLDLARTLFVVVTKSGTTIETMSKFWIAWEKVGEIAGDRRHQHFVAITDPEKGSLRAIAEEQGLTTFDVPANVGGRFSVLTAVGLVPLALAGYPIDELLDGARRARDIALADNVRGNALLLAAADHVLLQRQGVETTVMMAYSDLLGPLVEWFCQLWGESLAKARDRDGEPCGLGLTPVKAVGVVDQHSQLQLYIEGPADKHVVFVEVEEFEHDVEVPHGLPDSLSHLNGKSLGQILAAELRGTRAAIQQVERPTTTWRFDRISAQNIGAFIVSWELITAFVGEIWNINAFDQPGVELGKKIAHGLLGRDGFSQFAALATDADEPSIQIV